MGSVLFWVQFHAYPNLLSIAAYLFFSLKIFFPLIYKCVIYKANIILTRTPNQKQDIFQGGTKVLSFSCNQCSGEF